MATVTRYLLAGAVELVGEVFAVVVAVAEPLFGYTEAIGTLKLILGAVATFT